MAEALYGLDENFIKQVKEKLPDPFVETLNKGYKKVRKLY